jgi:nitroimidazol reductase NimA-like FMN-containing flavoprotein (pyridoxamine 5'-phosphate oxidase superfamily)
MKNLDKTTRTTVHRHPERGFYDRETINHILDEAYVCHVAFVHDGHPVVIPTLYGRRDDRVFFHGSSLSRMLQTLSTGVDVSVGVTIVDGLVLARSAFNHSMNYRSVVIFGRASCITDDEEKVEALRIISDHVLPGRWEDIRGPSRKELNTTTVLWLPISEASAKVRTGPPKDQEEDYQLTHWAGVVPIRLVWEEPQPDPRLARGITVPAYLHKLYRAHTNSGSNRE